MELLESQDPLKRKLIASSDRHKRELQKEVKEIAERTERTMTNALIIGGSLALAYLVVSQISSTKKKKKKYKIARIPKLKVESTKEEQAEDEEEVQGSTNLISAIGTQVMNQATAMLLEIAREKLMEFLASRMKSDESPNEK
jgi:ADP-ribosylglycohydrolase